MGEGIDDAHGVGAGVRDVGGPAVRGDRDPVRVAHHRDRRADLVGAGAERGHRARAIVGDVGIRLLPVARDRGRACPGAAAGLGPLPGPNPIGLRALPIPSYFSPGVAARTGLAAAPPSPTVAGQDRARQSQLVCWPRLGERSSGCDGSPVRVRSRVPVIVAVPQAGEQQDPAAQASAGERAPTTSPPGVRASDPRPGRSVPAQDDCSGGSAEAPQTGPEQNTAAGWRGRPAAHHGETPRVLRQGQGAAQE